MEVEKDMEEKRVLYALNEDMVDSLLSGNIRPREGIIVEISPDGKYVKIWPTSSDEREGWYRTDDITILSVLGETGINPDSEEMKNYL